MIQTSERAELRRRQRATRYLRRAPATARVVYLPVTTKSRAGIKYTHYKPFLQHLRA